jgi:hypothetical protein
MLSAFVRALLFATTIGLAPLRSAEAELSRAGDAARDTPAWARPAAARGALISARPFDSAAALPSAARIFSFSTIREARTTRM